MHNCTALNWCWSEWNTSWLTCCLKYRNVGCKWTTVAALGKCSWILMYAEPISNQLDFNRKARRAITDPSWRSRLEAKIILKWV